MLCSPSSAASRARILIGCYRKGEAADGEVYVSALVSVLCRYPEAVVKSVTDPATGLPGSVQWLPTIAEVKAACEAAMAPIYRERQRAQIANQAALLPAPAPATAEERLRAVDHWEQIVRPKIVDAGPPKENPVEAEVRLRERGLSGLHLGPEITKILDAMRDQRGAA